MKYIYLIKVITDTKNILLQNIDINFLKFICFQKETFLRYKLL